MWWTAMFATGLGPVAGAQEPTLDEKMARAEANAADTPAAASVGGTSPGIAQLTLRGGYAKYYAFDFATVGLEAAVRVLSGLHAVAGFEVYAVNIVLPPEIQLSTGVYSEWNVIGPINVGGIYKLEFDRFEPYFGADMIGVQYYNGDDGTAWAFGARGRGGLDYMLHPNFGLNVNVALGGWSGRRWSDLQTGLPSAGLLPQVSAGVVGAF